MPIWLTILSGAAGIVGVILSIYVVVDSKLGTRKKQIQEICKKLADHEVRIIQTERVTKVVEEFMEDLLVDTLKSKKRQR